MNIFEKERMIAFRFLTLPNKFISKLKADLDDTILPTTRRAQTC